MIVQLITCNGYCVLRSIRVNDPSELPAICASEENLRNDGFSVVAMCGGMILADSDGMVECAELCEV